MDAFKGKLDVKVWMLSIWLFAGFCTLVGSRGVGYRTGVCYKEFKFLFRL